MKIIQRCHWVNNDQIYIDYHDYEWGVPLHDDDKLFEFLILEGFQAGLSWITILKKRDNFRKAFDNFKALKIVKYGDQKIEELMQDSGIIRNRLKIKGTIINARLFLEIQQEYGSFDTYIWQFVGGQVLVNQSNMKYIKAEHVVAGFEFNTKFDSKISIEGYFKNYSNYPFLLRNQVSLANLGANYGAIGNETANSTSKGRTYGVEFLFQQRLYKGFYGIFAYTYGRSEFTDGKGNYAPSAWDSRNIAVATLGYQFKRNWEVGVKYRASSGLPYTPDAASSNIVALWQANGKAIPDFTRLNSQRTGSFNTFDFRVDKKWFGKKATWNVYFDIQNTLGAAVVVPQTVLNRPLDANKRPIAEAKIFKDANGVERYETKQLDNSTGNATPSIGLQIDF